MAKCDPYFRDDKSWSAELSLLREVLLEFPLTEALKWRQPCYVYRGSNLAILHRMKQYCGVAFFKGSLLDDPQGVLVSPGADSQASRQLRYTSVRQIESEKPLIRTLVVQAMKLEEEGRKVEFKAKHELEYPPELVEHMERDRAFAEAFEALTPGRKRGYVLHISAAKQSKTRVRRVESHVPKIMAGQGLHDR